MGIEAVRSLQLSPLSWWLFVARFASPSPSLETEHLSNARLPDLVRFFPRSTSPHIAVARDDGETLSRRIRSVRRPIFIMTLQAQLQSTRSPFPLISRHRAKKPHPQTHFSQNSTSWTPYRVETPTPKRYQGLQVITESLRFDPESAVTIAGTVACEASADRITRLLRYFRASSSAGAKSTDLQAILRRLPMSWRAAHQNLKLH